LKDHYIKYPCDQIKRRNLMNKQNPLKNLWFWLAASILLIVVTLAIQDVSRRATTASIPDTGAGAPAGQAQSVPEAGVQGVADYIEAHSGPSAQTVPDAAAQGVAGYLQAHGTRPIITDPAQKGVMDYLRAHGIEVP
jgi:hypothetical protein